MNEKQFTELLLQSLEHENGGILIYEAALKCAANADLCGEWEKCLEQTRLHALLLTDACVALGLDPDRFTPGRRVIQEFEWSLVAAMEKISVDGPSPAAELLACECVVMTKTRHHLNWDLIGKGADRLRGDGGGIIKGFCNEIESQGRGGPGHARDWCRELWIESLGMRAMLPPPAEREPGRRRGRGT